MDMKPWKFNKPLYSPQVRHESSNFAGRQLSIVQPSLENIYTLAHSNSLNNSNEIIQKKWC